MDLLKKKVTSL